MESIKLINGGSFAVMDLTGFTNPAYRVDPSTLPDLPAGVNLSDLKHTLDVMSQDSENYALLQNEIYVRQYGYLPQFGPDNRDQYGYGRDGFDSDGRDRHGFTPEERDADPMLEDVLHPLNPVRGSGSSEKRPYVRVSTHRGSVKGQVVVSVDETARTLHECWRDFFVYNEAVPVQDRLGDDELAARMAELFPDQDSERIRDVKTMRWLYNKGKLACQKGKPPVLESRRYIYDSPSGKVYQTTARGKLLKAWDIKPLLLGKESERL